MKFLFVNAKNYPYTILDFGKPLKSFILKNLNTSTNLKNFFSQLEDFLSQGYYLGLILSYELGYFFEEKFKNLRKDFYSFPLAYAGIYKKPQRYKCTLKEFREYEDKFEDFKPNIDKSEYFSAIKKIKDYISSGDTYQVNYTFKIKFRYKGDLENLFFKLLFCQRCEYAFFIREKDWSVLSFSPELFLKKKGNILISSPMKGTISRGYILTDDKRKKQILKNNEKDRAENIMIVDLIRNDMGRICKFGSVYVSELFKIKTYPTLHQMISTIKGDLRTHNLYEIFKALFPCGSVTGAPKIRTMEIIHELEKEERHVYTGAIGFVTPKKEFLFNVAIRTLIFWHTEIPEVYQGEAGIGGGIVWDSIEEKEYNEAILKAKFFTFTFPYFELIETIYFPFEKNLLLPYHYKRLKNSAKYFRFKIPKELSTYENWLKFLNSQIKSTEPLRVKLRLSPEGKFKIDTFPFEPWNKNLKIGLKKRDFPTTVFLFHKTTNRNEYDYYRKEALKQGVDEIIFYDENGYLLEGTISNVFIDLGDKVLYTPPINLGLLNGVLRSYLISQEKVKEKKLHINDLNKAKRIYIGNAVRGLGKVKEWVIL